MPVHCTARMTDSERLSRPPATTSYPSTYHPLGVERLFTRQLQPPKVCGRQALPRAAARPEHRTLGCHVSTPGPGVYCPLQEGHIGAMGEGGEPGAALRHFGASAAVRLLNLDRRSPARQVRRVGRKGWGDGQVGEVSEGRAALAPVAAPVGGCEYRESCCSCVYTAWTRVHPLRTHLTGADSYGPSSRSARDLSRSSRARMPPTSPPALPANAGGISSGISNSGSK
eukprot:scaffold2862_cov56-Phaeocystis_antarctica.AAC.1